MLVPSPSAVADIGSFRDIWISQIGSAAQALCRLLMDAAWPDDQELRTSMQSAADAVRELAQQYSPEEYSVVDYPRGWRDAAPVERRLPLFKAHRAMARRLQELAMPKLAVKYAGKAAAIMSCCCTSKPRDRYFWPEHGHHGLDRMQWVLGQESLQARCHVADLLAEVDCPLLGVMLCSQVTTEQAQLGRENAETLHARMMEIKLQRRLPFQLRPQLFTEFLLLQKYWVALQVAMMVHGVCSSQVRELLLLMGEQPARGGAHGVPGGIRSQALKEASTLTFEEA